VAQLARTEPFIVPDAIFDEIVDTCARLSITLQPPV